MALPQDAEAARRGKSQPRSQVQSDKAPDQVTYGRREDVMRFAAEVAESRLLDRTWVEAALAQARFIPSVARLIMPPAVGVAKNWAAYRARFIEAQRIRAGLAFWQSNEAWLDAAERQFGVPADVIVGIIGVETFYGRMTGGFRVLDALATLAFDFPAGRKDRSAFFRDELAQFLMLAHREGQAPDSFRGSYAGAIGLGQFMPSSILKYAVDFDGDGHVDMIGNPADVIGSIANYLAAFGWTTGMPTHFAVKTPVDAADRAAMLLPDIEPTFTAQQLAERGAALPKEAMQHDGPLALIELQNGGAAPSHLLGTHNFYVVTRYNWSAYYALAVIELGQSIKARRPHNPTAR